MDAAMTVLKDHEQDLEVQRDLVALCDQLEIIGLIELTYASGAFR